MFGRFQKPEPDAIEVIIGPRASFNGDLRSDTSIRIDGALDDGRIETPANVILTETARVRCEIMAKTVSIRGMFQGVIRADRVELLEGSKVYGALHVNSFYMDEGVLLQAELNIKGAQVEDIAPPARPESTDSIPVVSPAQKMTGQPATGDAV